MKLTKILGLATIAVALFVGCNTADNPAAIAVASAAENTPVDQEPVDQKPVAPTISNIRWGTTVDSVKEANKANWENAVIRTGDALYVGFDTDTSKVESLKFMLARNDKDGKNGKDQFKLYATHKENKDWGIIDANGIWATYTWSPTNYVGEAKVCVEIKYKNGKYNWVNVAIPVESR